MLPGHPGDLVVDLIVSPGCPGSALGPPPSWACLKDLPREVSRRPPSQIPEPPQLVHLDGEIQLPNFSPCPSGRAQSPCKENSFLPLESAALFLWSRPKSDDHKVRVRSSSLFTMTDCFSIRITADAAPIRLSIKRRNYTQGSVIYFQFHFVFVTITWTLIGLVILT